MALLVFARVIWATVLKRPVVVLQLYEEDSGGVAGDDLAVILEIMLGVKEVELSPLFLELEAQHTAKITYGKTLSFSALQIIYFTFLFIYWDFM